VNKVIDKHAWNSNNQATVETILSQFLELGHPEGSIEELESRIERVTELLLYIACNSGFSATDLNKILGYNRFKDVETLDFS